MAAIWMKIDKFGDEPVKINEDHPLAVAQRAKDSKKESSSGNKTANTSTGNTPTVPVVPAPGSLPIAERLAAMDYEDIKGLAASVDLKIGNKKRATVEAALVLLIEKGELTLPPSE